MKKKGSEESFSEEERTRLESLLDDSSKLLPLYFISTALVYTNGSYDYFMEHKNFDGFLADFGYPIGDFEDGGIIKAFSMAINQAYSLNELYYNAVMKSGCMKDNNEQSYIDNVCLRNKSEVNDINNDRMTAWRALGKYSDMMLDLIIADADNIKEMVVNGGIGK